MSADYPRLAEGVFCARRDEHFLFLAPAVPDWLVVNNNAALILSQCTGNNSINDICRLYDIPYENVARLLNDAESHGIVSQALNEKKCISANIMDDAVYSASPSIVHLSTTNACNLRCIYCYAESGARNIFVDNERLKNIAEEVLTILQAADYMLSGGEPLLHPGVIDFAEHLKGNGNHVSLLTNGTLVTSDNIDRIACLFDQVRISLDGASEKTHSITRGSGHFHHVRDTVDKLLDRGANVQIAMTVHRENLHEIDSMAEAFGGILTFQPLFTAGRGSKCDDLTISGREYYEALANVKNVSPLANIGRLLEGLRRRGTKRCALARNEISIDEEGNVYPCQLLATSDFCAGNIFKRPLHDIYYNSDVFKKLRRISIDTLEKCKTCPVRLLCGGGCRARDYHEVGDIGAVGEFCEYEQSAFINGIFESVFMKELSLDP